MDDFSNSSHWLCMRDELIFLQTVIFFENVHMESIFKILCPFDFWKKFQLIIESRIRIGRVYLVSLQRVVNRKIFALFEIFLRESIIFERDMHSCQGISLFYREQNVLQN